MSAGQYVRIGTKLSTTFPEEASSMETLIDSFYGAQYDIAKSGIMKSAGAAIYGDNGYFNAVMGKQITAGMFASDTVFTAIGARPYNHEGVRIALELPDYGIDAEGNFTGLGASTVQDGLIPPSVKLPVNEYRQPYKDLPFRYDYGLGLMALEAKEDDTTSYQQYVDMMTRAYTDYADRTLLRPITVKQPTVDGVETSLTGIERAISSFAEKKLIQDWEAVDENTAGSMICPYGGLAGDFRDRAAAASNLDSQLVNANGAALSVEMLGKLHRRCSIAWTDMGSPNNKAFFMSNIAQDKLNALFMAQNVLLDQVYVQRGFSGVKTMPGRGAGFVTNAFRNVPIITSLNMNFDYSTKRVSETKIGNIMLLDLDHIWLSMLTPVEFWSNNNPAITQKLQEINVMNMRAELRIDSFIQHGKIVHLADEDA